MRGHLSPFTLLAILALAFLFSDGQGLPVHNWPGLLLVCLGAYWIIGRL